MLASDATNHRTYQNFLEKEGDEEKKLEERRRRKR